MKQRKQLCFFIALSLFFVINNCDGQLNSGTELNLNAIKTELKNNAIGIGIKYTRSLDSLWEKQDYLMAGKHSLLMITPEFNTLTGTADAFSSITAKITMLAMTFRDTTIAGFKTPNTARTFQTFPVSIGVETNNSFNFVNAILEIGWVPWYQAQQRKAAKILKHTSFGLFFEWGNQFSTASKSKDSVFIPDQNKGQLNKAILRMKGNIGIDTKKISFNGLRFGFATSGDGWWDISNRKLYYHAKAVFRFYLTDKTSYDIHYEKGSGAPDFNESEQFGMGISLNFK
ncbi:MAG: hypothetical protein QM737_05860 [Ferruginibacter sp.]